MPDFFDDAVIDRKETISLKSGWNNTLISYTAPNDGLLYLNYTLRSLADCYSTAVRFNLTRNGVDKYVGYDTYSFDSSTGFPKGDANSVGTLGAVIPLKAGDRFWTQEYTTDGTANNVSHELIVRACFKVQ